MIINLGEDRAGPQCHNTAQICGQLPPSSNSQSSSILQATKAATDANSSRPDEANSLDTLRFDPTLTPNILTTQSQIFPPALESSHSTVFSSQHHQKISRPFPGLVTLMDSDHTNVNFDDGAKFGGPSYLFPQGEWSKYHDVKGGIEISSLDKDLLGFYIPNSIEIYELLLSILNSTEIVF